jgi:cytochrome b
MESTPLFDAATAGPAATPRPVKARAGRLVIDAPTRMFHWLFALSFLGAYLTAESEHWRALHVTLGYTLAGLLGFRLLYGLFGPRQSGLGMLWRRVAGTPAWLRSTRQAFTLRQWPSATHWRQGQNLLMPLAVLALLALVLPLTLSGYASYQAWGDVLGGELFEALHEGFANAFVAVALGHVALVAALSLWRRKNQARPMLTGRTEGPGPDLVKANRGWLAAVLLMAVLAFGAWQWQQAPQGLVPGPGWAAEAEHEQDD